MSFVQTHLKFVGKTACFNSVCDILQSLPSLAGTYFKIPWKLFSHLFGGFECVNVNCVMDVIDVSLGWKQTVTTEDLVIFLQSQENAAI